MSPKRHMKRTTDQIDIDRFVALWEDDVHIDQIASELGVFRERLLELARRMKLRYRAQHTMRGTAGGQTPDPTPEEIEREKLWLQSRWSPADERARRGADDPYEIPVTRLRIG